MRNINSNDAPVVINNAVNTLIANSLINKNTSMVGAVLNLNYEGTSLKLINSVIYDNEGQMTDGKVSTGPTYIQNSVLWQNKASGSTSALGVDIFPEDSELGTISPVVSNSITQVFGGNSNARLASVLVGQDPLFTNASAGDFSLQEDSPAINAGDNPCMILQCWVQEI